MPRPTHSMASTVSERAQKPDDEHVHEHPANTRDIVGKAMKEAKPKDGAWEKVKAMGREVDRNIGGVYEEREQEMQGPEE